MPAPVSPSHMVLALAAAIAGVDSRTDVREVIVERCVAVGDESYANEQEAAHRQSSWKIASQLHCSSQTLSDGMDAFASSAVCVVDARVGRWLCCYDVMTTTAMTKYVVRG
eukprot:3549441-Pleurochrysis_carterae.AAC.1